MSDNHKHFCPDCPEESKWWEHDRSLRCILEDGARYPCVPHIGRHVVFVEIVDIKREPVAMSKAKE